jgi:hypothetical protein
MRTHETDAPRGIGAAAKLVAERASSLIRLELELATMEIKRKVIALGLGIGLGVGAAIFLFFMVAFALATAAAALAIVVSTWLALLIIAGVCLGLAGLLGVLALASIRKGTPPVPEKAIREAKLTTEALKSDGSA